jgi:hypothetical protein
MLGGTSNRRLQTGALAGLLLLLLPVAGPAGAETWKADMQLNKARSAGMCQRGAENTFTLELTGSTLIGSSLANSFRAPVAADGSVNDVFVGELDAGLATTVTTKMPRFTIAGNAKTRELEMTWPSGACRWTLKPRA